MNHIGIIFTVCLLLCYHINGQIVKVVNNSTPLEGVELTDRSNLKTIVTDQNGEVDLKVLKNANIITFFKAGFKIKDLSMEEINQLGYVVEMEVRSLELDQLVISGTRWQQYSDRVPSKIIKINRSEIQLLNPQTAADLLGMTSKVFIQKSQQGGGSPMIRGFATNRLLYTVDGVRMNTAIFRGGNLQNVINLDPFSTESAEVLFGPGSVIYGSDAIGGVMAFQTLTPKLSETGKTKISGNVNSRYSSANQEKTMHADWMISGKMWSSVSSISYWNYDHLRQGRYGPNDYVKKVYVERQGTKDVVVSQKDSLLQIPSGYDQFNLMQKIRYQAKENLVFQYGFHYSSTSDFGRYDRNTRFRNGLPRHAEWNYGPQRWMMNQLTVEYGEKTSFYDVVTLRMAIQKFDESRIDRNFNNISRNTQSEQVLAYSANLDFLKKWREMHHFFYGAEYVLNDVTSTGFTTNISNNNQSIGASRYPQAVWSSAAIYINDEIMFKKQWTLQGGLRYNYYALNSDFRSNLPFFPLPFSEAKLSNGSLTGSIGTVIRPTDKLVIRLNTGTAFRSPNVDDIGKIFDSAVRFVTVPNQNLKAEYAYNTDIGFAYVLGEVAKIDVSAYYTYLKNALVRRDFQLAGQDSIVFNGVMSKVQAIQNAAFAQVYGIQAGLEVKLMKNLTFFTDWNFQKGEEETDNGMVNPSRHAAPLFGTNRLRFQSGKISLELNSMHQSEKSFEELPQEEQVKTEIYAKDESGRSYAPGWYTINFKGSWQPSKFLQLTAGVENITDQRYRPYSSGISGAGINFIAGIRFSF